MPEEGKISFEDLVRVVGENQAVRACYFYMPGRELLDLSDNSWELLLEELSEDPEKLEGLLRKMAEEADSHVRRMTLLRRTNMLSDVGLHACEIACAQTKTFNENLDVIQLLPEGSPSRFSLLDVMVQQAVNMDQMMSVARLARSPLCPSIFRGAMRELLASDIDSAELSDAIELVELSKGTPFAVRALRRTMKLCGKAEDLTRLWLTTHEYAGEVPEREREHYYILMTQIEDQIGTVGDNFDDLSAALALVDLSSRLHPILSDLLDLAASFEDWFTQITKKGGDLTEVSFTRAVEKVEEWEQMFRLYKLVEGVYVGRTELCIRKMLLLAKTFEQASATRALLNQGDSRRHDLFRAMDDNASTSAHYMSLAAIEPDVERVGYLRNLAFEVATTYADYWACYEHAQQDGDRIKAIMGIVETAEGVNECLEAFKMTATGSNARNGLMSKALDAAKTMDEHVRIWHVLQTLPQSDGLKRRALNQMRDLPVEDWAKIDHPDLISIAADHLVKHVKTPEDRQLAANYVADNDSLFEVSDSGVLWGGLIAATESFEEFGKLRSTAQSSFCDELFDQLEEELIEHVLSLCENMAHWEVVWYHTRNIPGRRTATIGRLQDLVPNRFRDWELVYAMSGKIADSEGLLRIGALKEMINRADTLKRIRRVYDLTETPEQVEHVAQSLGRIKTDFDTWDLFSQSLERAGEIPPRFRSIIVNKMMQTARKTGPDALARVWQLCQGHEHLIELEGTAKVVLAELALMVDFKTNAKDA